MLALTGALYAQSSRGNQTETAHFQITSLLVDGHEVAQFELRFLIKDRELIPKRDGRNYFVPKEVYEALAPDRGIRFIGNNFDFTLQNFTLKGYLDSDKIKSDYAVKVDTIPHQIELRHLSQLTKKEKRSLGIRSYKDVCAVFTFTPSNLVVVKSEMIVDPITTKTYQLCRN